MAFFASRTFDAKKEKDAIQVLNSVLLLFTLYRQQTEDR